MKRIELSDIKNLIEYEKARPAFRSKVIEQKKDRRISVGDRITLVFENRLSVLFQIQEMIRVERMVDNLKIQHEIDTYNELVPGKNELSATLFVEVEDQEMIKPVLDSLVGLNKDSVYLKIANDIIPAIFEEGHATDDRISAVQYIKFKLNPAQIDKFRSNDVEIMLVIRHRNYNAQTNLPENVRRALYHDLVDDGSENLWN
jgi:hypothetical protein